LASNLKTPNNIIDSDIKEYKICAGKGCNNLGKYRLSIIYINRTGYFCLNCKKELEDLGIVYYSEIKETQNLGVNKHDLF
jgi:hypothetical protein